MSRNAYLLRRYGITNEQYEELYRKQGGRCAVCERPASEFKAQLCVDHEHSIGGQVRGLLCNFCNRFLVGRHRRGSGSQLLRRAYEYLDREYTGWIVPPKKKRKKKKRARLKKLRKL